MGKIPAGVTQVKVAVVGAGAAGGGATAVAIGSFHKLCANLCARGWRFTLLAILLSSASAQTIHYRTAKGLLLVDVEVGNVPATMIFDTGCTETVISTSIVNLSIQAPEMRPTALGTGGKGFSAHVQRIALGHTAWLNSPVIVANVNSISNELGTKVDGILGIDLIGRAQSVTINFKDQTIKLELGDK